MSDVIIQAQNLGKKYVIGHQVARGDYITLRDVLVQNARGYWRKVKDLAQGKPVLQGDVEEEVWALKGVSFEIKRGEVVGIIGRNGAGKSTLLKVLSRITEPSAGRVTIKGRVSSLLEVGTGFHPELTGRENIYLNGAILGMTRAEIKSKFDEIVAFAEVERFLDTPVKRYSSGMYVRLAFAVAAHLEPEIMVVDEVLAVGDAQFQRKCLGKMKDVSTNQGRTVLFVSHNMTAVQTLCGRAVMLVGGALSADGTTGEVVTQYLRGMQNMGEEHFSSDSKNAPGNDLIRIRRVRAVADCEGGDGLLTMQTPIRIETEFWVLRPGVTTHLTYHLVNEYGVIVLTTGCWPTVRSPGVYKATWRLPGNLLNSGMYFLKLLVVRNENQVVYSKESIASFTLVEASGRDTACMGREPGVVQPPLEWDIEELNNG